ncbi:MAG: transcriptional coactivator p15/PC4 family protein [Polyangiaceae bacterium]|nr:transcriptional coactivator p15/PC4 family protein [Polyangiaceae bacterium]
MTNNACAPNSLACFPRSETEQLIMALREYEGCRYLDIHVYFRANDGAWRPIKKGVTVRLSELFAFSDAVAAAMAKVAPGATP